MGVPYQHPRGSKAALNTLASGGNLRVGQIYMITDEDRIAIALTTSTYQEFEKKSESLKTFATITAMAGTGIQTNGTLAYVTDENRGGMFKYTTGNLSALVSADTQQGIYVAPTSASTGASGAWVRVWDGINGYPEWFGAISDSSAAASGNLTALQATVALCPTTNLKRADYWISNTWKVNTPWRTIKGFGGIAYDATQGTRVLVTSGSADTMQVGPDTNPGGNPGTTFLRQVTIQNIQLSRSVTLVPNSTVPTSATGLRAKYLYHCQFDNVYSWENSVGFYVGGTVACNFNHCFAFRSAAASTTVNDVAIGWYLDGQLNIGLAGGNASLRLESCYSSISDGLTGTPDPNRYGLRAVGAFVDTFVSWFETVGGYSGLSFIGTGSGGSTASNTDLHIVHPVIDQPTNRAIEIGDLAPGGSVNIEGMYFGTGASVPYGMVFFDCHGQITVDGTNATGTDGAANTFGIFAITSSGIHITESNKFTNFERPASFDTVTDFTYKARIKNQNAEAENVCAFTGCARGVIAPSFSGAIGSPGHGVYLVGSGNSHLDINTTGLRTASIAGNLIRDNTTPITSEGPFGTNCLARGTNLTNRYATLDGSTFTGPVTTPASTVTTAGLKVPHGTAPSAPVDGDLWSTTAGFYGRVNGATVGPFGTGGGGGTTTNSVTFNNTGGAAAGTAFNGSAAVTVSHATVGALALTGGSLSGALTITPTTGNVITLGNASAVATGTPVNINMGASYSNAAGANPKLQLFNDGGVLYGFGVSTSQLDYMAPASCAHGFYVATTGKVATISNAGIAVNVGKLTTLASTTGGASLTVPHGVAPSAPVDGDIWTTTAGFFSRVNGAVKQVAFLDSNITGSAASLTTARNINGVAFNGTANININLNNSLTFNNSGTGAASGTTFSGASAATISYNTIGALASASPTVGSGKLTLVASATGAASLNIPHGVAPSAPADGDVWTTTAGMYARINGSTVGPFGAGGGGGSPGGADTQIQYNNAGVFGGSADFTWNNTSKVLSLGPSGVAGTSTPTKISLGGTFSNVAGANAKIELFASGGDIYGLGLSSGQMDFMVPSGAGYGFHIAGTEYAEINNNGLALKGTTTGITLEGIGTEPAAPSSGNMRLYAKSIAGKLIPKIKGPSGLDYPLQASFWQNNITMWNPTTVTAGVWLGTAGAGAGTYSTALPTTTNIYTSMKRARWANVATTANQVLGQRNTEAMYMRGSVAGQGGFFFFARCGMDVWTNGGRFFAGMHTATTVVSGDPSALNNTVGFCVDAADNGAISFLTRGTAATKASTGFTLASNTGFDLYMFCAPNSSEIHWRIVNINTGAEASGTATANLPSNTTLLTAGVLASNAALTPVTSIQLGLNRIYVETDY